MPFITNSGKKSLEDRLKEIVSKTKEINILVGFFYFSAVPSLYESIRALDEKGQLKEGHIKVLVGLDVDQHVGNLYEYAFEVKRFTNKNLLEENFLRSIERAFTSSYTDIEEINNQVRFFLRLLQEGKLQIRKTRKPNHAKLYLFILEDIITPHLFITGSSNLTMAGLSAQEEFNVEIKDYGFEEAKRYFDDLWKSAVALEPNKVVESINTKTFLKELTPFEAYVHALKTYLQTYTDLSENSERNIRNILEEAKYKAYSYQVEAIAQAEKILQTHGGAILADVVGLGKSVIATAVARVIGERGIVIAPPHLVGDENGKYGWRKYLADFDLHGWRVYSLGKLEDALEYVNNHEDIKVVIVDEAHRFRNENTLSYHLLHQICKGKKVLLLSATPFNNRPSDIFAMLKLFTIPKRSSIVFDENLKAKFDKFERDFEKLSYIKTYHNSKRQRNRRVAQRYYKELFGEEQIDMKKVQERAKNMAQEIKSIIQPVVIRRNRLDLKYYPEKLDLPEVKDPIEQFFELSPEQSKFYDEVIQAFEDIEEGGRFSGAIYFPERYKKEREPEGEDFTYLSQKNLYSFMRRLLVKRFESSFWAFRQSIERFLRIHRNTLEFIQKTGKFVIDRKLVEQVLNAEDEEEIMNLLSQFEKNLEEKRRFPKYEEVYDLEDMKRAGEFVEDIQRDIKLFEELLERFDKVGLSHQDPKAERLVETIREFLKDRKVVVFTEYKDTAEYLKRVLQEAFGGQVLVAYGSLSRSTLEEIQKNFDASSPEQKDQYKILVATDKLSEGINLNRAGVVINYDIPWNPVRVIQRVGRINRIGKKLYQELYIVNFFPTERGADIVRSREIAQNKMFMIHKVLGEDAKIFSPDEEPTPSDLYKRLNTYQELEEESFITKVRKEFEEIRKNYPELVKNLEGIPQRVKVAKRHTEENLVVLIKKGDDLFVAYKRPQEEHKIVSFEQVYEHIRAKPEDQALPLSAGFWQAYSKVLEGSLKDPKTSSRDVESQALNVLGSLRQREDLPTPLRDFLQDLAEEIRELGTLSEYALRRIIEWERLDLEKLQESIAEFMKSYRKPKVEQKVLEPVYIISIENQVQ